MLYTSLDVGNSVCRAAAVALAARAVPSVDQADKRGILPLMGLAEMQQVGEDRSCGSHDELQRAGADLRRQCPLPRSRSSAAFRTRALATVSCSIMRWRDVGRNASAIGADQGNDQGAGPARLTNSKEGEDNGRSHRGG